MRAEAATSGELDWSFGIFVVYWRRGDASLWGEDFVAKVGGPNSLEAQIEYLHASNQALSSCCNHFLLLRHPSIVKPYRLCRNTVQAR